MNGARASRVEAISLISMDQYWINFKLVFKNVICQTTENTAPWQLGWNSYHPLERRGYANIAANERRGLWLTGMMMAICSEGHKKAQVRKQVWMETGKCRHWVDWEYKKDDILNFCTEEQQVVHSDNDPCKKCGFLLWHRKDQFGSFHKSCNNPVDFFYIPRNSTETYYTFIPGLDGPTSGGDKIFKFWVQHSHIWLQMCKPLKIWRLVKRKLKVRVERIHCLHNAWKSFTTNRILARMHNSYQERYHI